MRPRFLLDEHVNRAIQRQLRRLDPRINVLAINDSDAPPAGTSDPDILLWIEKSGYILVTENRSTIPGHLSDHYAARWTRSWYFLASAACQPQFNY